MLNLRSRDEIGRLAHSFRELVAYIKGNAGAADQLAQGNLAIAIEPRSDQDVLSHSFQHIADKLCVLLTQLNAQAEELSNLGANLKEVVPQFNSGHQTPLALPEYGRQLY